MKIICPKCQYENQADSSRIVCARCATIIEVKQDPGMGTGTGMDSNGRRQTARLPFVGNVGNSQPLNNPLNSQPNNQPPPPNRDVYATRVGDDFDDVLDIPRQTQPGYPAGNEPTTAFEDVFAMPNYDAPPSYDFPPQEKKPTAPIEGFPTGQSRQRSTQDYAQSPEPEFMGWPVLPESADDDPEQIGNFSSNRGALLARVALGVVVFGLLSFLAYYFLGDKIARRGDGHPSVASNETAAGKSPAGTTYPPAAVPSLEPKAPEVKPPASEKSNPAETSHQAANKPQPSAPSQAKDNSQKVVIEPKLPSGKSGYTQPPKPAAAAPAKGSLVIQVASFNDQAQANDRVARLRQFNVEARVVQAEVSGKTWYRVQIGGYKSREEASSQASQLKSKGAIQDYIITTVGK